MSLMPSLCAALERAGGDRLVMRAGERPHVLAGEHRHDVASAVLSVNAVEALAEQILSSTARHDLAAFLLPLYVSLREQATPEMQARILPGVTAALRTLD